MDCNFGKRCFNRCYCGDSCMVSKIEELEERFEKLRKNEERQNQEINKLIERNKIMVEMIKQNSESIKEGRRDLIDILKWRQF